jgi:CubicO group peptidase (beta-lactamase class C family)
MHLSESISLAWKAAQCPGAAIASISDGQISVVNLGVRDIESGEPVTDQTIFDVASLTKPMVAYAVLQLVDQGVIDLDTPLSEFTTPVVPDNPVSSRITARHILTHTSGLQNLRGDEPIRVYFEPGSRYSYSSIGFMYLQRALEALTNESLESTMRRLVFEPLDMSSSSLVWNARFENNVAISHENGERLGKHRPLQANASYSLQTTAADYSRFVAAVLQGARLKPDTYCEWLKPTTNAPKESALQLEDASAEFDAGIAWGLGWGLESERGTFFQWGKMNGVRAFVMGSPRNNSGAVLLTNGNTGLRLLSGVADLVLPREHPAVRWLEVCVTE